LRRHQPITTAAPLKILHDLRPGLTAHGFRSTFRDWAGDCTHYPRELIEHAMGHRLKDKAEAAYRRSDALEKRRRLMQDWADYADGKKIKDR
jgi:integrase